MEAKTLFDPPPPAVRDSPTSVAAGESMAGPVADIIRTKVLDHIRFTGGSTCDECEYSLNLRHQTAGARIRELVQMGLLRDSGVTRKTRSGRAAIVWIEGGK
jgi:predicted transcriptional regulator